VEEEQSRSSMSLRRRRSGLRSNKKRIPNTANSAIDSHRLKRIPEVSEEQKRDLSSSEKVPKNHARLLNDTILEEQESIEYNHVSMVVDDDVSMQENSSISGQEDVDA